MSSIVQQSLGVFQKDLPKIESALARVPFSERVQVGRFAVLHLADDPQFPASGAIKKIYYCVSQDLGSGKLGIHVASTHCLFDGFLERDVYMALSGAKRVVQPLLIEWKDGVEYIITELFNCGSLSNFLLDNARQLSSFRRDWIAYSVATAMLECHQAGVVLRDFKPQNVLVHKDAGGFYDLKITDLGLAFLMNQSTKQDATEFVGTLGYRAPECWDSYSISQKSSPASYASDAWSLGCFLFDLAIGRPFMPRVLKNERGQCVGETNRQFGFFKLGSFVGPIRSLLARNPKERPTLKALCFTMNQIFSTSHPAKLDLALMQTERETIQMLSKTPEPLWVIKEFLKQADDRVRGVIAAFVLDL